MFPLSFYFMCLWPLFPWRNPLLLGHGWLGMYSCEQRTMGTTLWRPCGSQMPTNLDLHQTLLDCVYGSLNHLLFHYLKKWTIYYGATTIYCRSSLFSTDTPSLDQDERNLSSVASTPAGVPSSSAVPTINTPTSAPPNLSPEMRKVCVFLDRFLFPNSCIGFVL